jgi:type VI secretion system protein ImpI
MYLALQITSSHAATMGQNASKIFSESGGTIGRANSNDWALPDEEKFISSRHAIIRYMGGMFSLEDVSTNGVFMNGATETVGSHNEPVILKSGDRIQIGDYEIYVTVVEGESAAASRSEPAWDPDPMVTSPSQMTSPPTSPTLAPGAGSSTLGPLDPLDLLGDDPEPPPPATPPSFSNHSPATSDYFSPPSMPGAGAGGAIPDDWDLTDFSASRSSASQPAPTPPPSAPPSGGGIPAPPVAPRQPAMAASGHALFDQLMPMIVQGMMDVLKSRAEIKSQFRLALTTIKPVENNPLKFSPNVDDAMSHLFGGQRSGYLGPAEAFEEGFNDIKAHQMAMLAGMRAAFEHMLEQFSPEVLEEHFEGGAKRGKLMGMASKVRYWDLYREMFNRITRDSDDNFRRLFGEEFAAAYEAQMQKITGRM